MICYFIPLRFSSGIYHKPLMKLFWNSTQLFRCCFVAFTLNFNCWQIFPWQNRHLRKYFFYKYLYFKVNIKSVRCQQEVLSLLPSTFIIFITVDQSLLYTFYVVFGFYFVFYSVLFVSVFPCFDIQTAAINFVMYFLFFSCEKRTI